MSDAQTVLKRSKVIAVVGCSATVGKPAHDVPHELVQMGYDVRPVNPTMISWEGRRCYAKLADVPGPIDIVDVFRPAPETPDVARQAVARGDVKAVWLQSGIVSDEARRIVEAAGLDYVEDRCVKVEARRIEFHRGRTQDI
jgi:predicted CoA-binding protein